MAEPELADAISDKKEEDSQSAEVADIDMIWPTAVSTVSAGA